MNETLAEDETDDFDRGMTSNLKAFNKIFSVRRRMRKMGNKLFLLVCLKCEYFYDETNKSELNKSK